MSATINLGEWHMIMRGPDGDEYAIASGQLPASILPDPYDDGRQILTVELAQFIHDLAAQVEALAIAGEIPDMSCSHDPDDIYSRPHDPPCR